MTLLLVMLVMVFGLAVSVHSYTFITLDIPGAISTYAHDINDSGIVVGKYTDSNYNSHGFKWAPPYDGSTYTTLDVPGAESTQAYGINDSGVIVGCYYEDNTFGTNHGFKWAPPYGSTTYATLDVNVPGDVKTFAYGINNSDDIVGYYWNHDGGTPQIHGFVYNGSYTTLDVEGVLYSHNYGINDSDVIVGIYQGPFGFKWEPPYDSMPLNELTIDIDWPWDINDKGFIVGFSGGQGLIYDGSTYTPLNVTLQGVPVRETDAYGISDSGVIVGSYNNEWHADGSGNHGFIAYPGENDPTWTEPPPPPPTPTGDSSSNFEYSCSGGHPINTHTGELYETYAPDFDLGGPMPLRFSRYYASGLNIAKVTGNMGNNWRHNFEWRLRDEDTTLYIVDSSGRLIQFEQNESTWNLTGKTDIVFQLFEATGQFTLLDPRDKRLYKFNANGQLIAIEDGRGNVHTLGYDGNGLLTQVTDGLGRVLSFNYDPDNHLVSVEDGTRTVNFAYTDGNLTTVTDPLGNSTSYAYSAGSLMTSTTHPAGNTPYTQTFHGDGKVATQTDSNSNITSFAYSGTDTIITNSLGNPKTHTHTATGELSNIQDQTGQNVIVGSDATGRRNAITDRLGDDTSYDYHVASGQMSSLTNTEGGATGFDYTARPVGDITFYDLTGVTHADNTTESFAYDGSGNLTSHTDQAGYESTFTYNGNGQVLSAVNPEGGAITKTYNGDGTQATSTDPAGNTTDYAYDLLRRLDVITYEDDATVQLVYDDSDNLLSVTDENGNSTTFGYDANNNLSTIINPLGDSTGFSYDGNDRLLSTTNPLGDSATVSYNELCKLATITDYNGNVTTFIYDTLGRLTSTTDPLGNTWSNTLDVEGILTSRTDPLGNTTTYSSDKMGRIIDVTSPLGHNASLTYDIMGRVAATIDPLSNTTTFTRDSRDLLTGISLPGGDINTTYTRNSLGNIIQVTDPNNNNWQSGFNAMGLRTSSTDPLGNTQTMAYDTRNRLATITYPDGTLRTTYYDPAGNLISSSYNGGSLVFNYTYDANNRMLSGNGISLGYDANNRITDSNGIAISRDAGGRIIGMTLAAGKEITYSYDANNQLIQVSDWAGGVTSFAYDAAGRLISITRPNGIDTTNAFDNDNHLTGITAGSVASIALTRDAKGQITGVTRDVPQAASAKGFTDQSSTFDAACQVAGFAYDLRGRLTSDDAWTYEWDLASRLASYTQDAVTTSFTYDATRHRLSRTSNGTTREYVWNYSLVLPSISVVRLDGSDLRYYIHTPSGNLLYSIEAADNTRRFYHYDEMGNTIFITDNSGTVIGSYAYLPFGRLIKSTGGLDNPFTWQGRFGVMDEGNGLYYIRARYYDSATGRFISRDPMKSNSPKSMNPYQYAWNNPLKYMDLNGMKPVNSVKDTDRPDDWQYRDYDFGPNAGPDKPSLAATNRDRDIEPRPPCKKAGAKDVYIIPWYYFNMSMVIYDPNKYKISAIFSIPWPGGESDPVPTLKYKDENLPAKPTYEQKKYILKLRIQALREEIENVYKRYTIFSINDSYITDGLELLATELKKLEIEQKNLELMPPEDTIESVVPELLGIVTLC